ncbi:MAG TPA: DUF2840 domain-containing protein [Methylocella sp.]|nr:DUF2840 domain-containing protein [Methylocella sp.]
MALSSSLLGRGPQNPNTSGLRVWRLGGAHSQRIGVERSWVSKSEKGDRIPSVARGDVIPLQPASWRKVQRVLEAIDNIEALSIHPKDAAPER